MDSDKNSLTKLENKATTSKPLVIVLFMGGAKKFIYSFIIITLVIFLFYLQFFLTFIRDKKESSIKNITNKANHNIYKNKLIKSNKVSHYISCSYTKNKLNDRSQPFEYSSEFFFITDLILCNIPFSFIRFADGENSIMMGEELTGIDRWHWSKKNKKFRENLIESASICINNNSFIGIPCKNWNKISESILSFSNCTSAKYFSYSTIFTNKNFKVFKNWIVRYINSTKRRKIILIANSIINKNISWAYKFFPVPDNLVDNWNNFSIPLLSKLSRIAKSKNLIFFISAGPAANIIISFLSKINRKNIYISF
jgi:hypothetical protein